MEAVTNYCRIHVTLILDFIMNQLKPFDILTLIIVSIVFSITPVEAYVLHASFPIQMSPVRFLMELCKPFP
jgi:hypothetical protein